MRRVFVAKVQLGDKTSYLITPPQTAPNLYTSLLHFQHSFPQLIGYFESLEMQAFKFCDTFRLVYTSLWSNHRKRFLFLRLYVCASSQNEL